MFESTRQYLAAMSWSMMNRLLIVVAAGILFGCSDRQTRAPELQVWTTETDPATLAVMDDVGRQLASSVHDISGVKVQSVKWSELSIRLQNAYIAGELPAVTHLEPFFMKSLVDKDLLLPVDDLVKELGEEDILEAVRKIPYFGNHYYGICQHFGVSFMTYRRDMFQRLGIATPMTWADMLLAARKVSERGGTSAVYLPGGDQFFFETVFFEALASNGGSAYSTAGAPDFDNPRVIETLEYLRELASYANRDWQSATYVDGFPRLVRGEVALDLFAGARATKVFEQSWRPPNAGAEANEVFAPLPPPRGPHGIRGFSSVDCEPFVIINQARNARTPSSARAIIENASRKYLLLLYRKDNYLKLMRSAPIQLIPIFKSMAPEYSQDADVKAWPVWYEQALTMIQSHSVAPYFTTDASQLNVPYLFELYGSKVVTELLNEVLLRKSTPEQAARDAQQKALAIAARAR